MTYTDNNEYNRRAIPNTAEEENVDSDLVREDMPSFEYFDGAMLNWVKDLNISADGNDGFKRIPVMWYGTERAHQIKSGMEIRDRSGTIILPVITVGRTGVSKSPSIKGAYYANIPAVRDYLGGTITVAKKLKHAKSSEFNNNRALQKTGQVNYKFVDGEVEPYYVYETKSIHIPVYLETTYEINIWTSYQQQMNEAVQAIVTNAQMGNLNYFTIGYKDYRFEAFMDENIVEENNVAALNTEDRRYKTKMTFKVLGYVIGEGKNQKQQNVVKREGITKVKFGVERLGR